MLGAACEQIGVDFIRPFFKQLDYGADSPEIAPP